MMRTSRIPPADLKVVRYADGDSKPIPLRSSVYASRYPAAPGSKPTRYIEDGRVLLTDQSFTGLMAEAVRAAVEREEAARVTLPDERARLLGPRPRPSAAGRVATNG